MGEFPRTNIKERVLAMEVERKYLMASEDDAKRLEEKVKQLFPDTHLLGEYVEVSYFYPKMLKGDAQKPLWLALRYRYDGAHILAELRKIPDDAFIVMRLRHRENSTEKKFVLTIKASANPLHDVERIEIETEDVSVKLVDFFRENHIEPESVWQSSRRLYQLDESTKIDVQNVTGYGWTAEIESPDLSQVDEIAGKLGLRPLSQTSLNAMYKQYGKDWQKYYAGEGDDRHFSEGDWKEIESTSGENRIINKLN